MEDDVIAYLYPYGNGQIAKDSERVIKDQPRHLPPRVKSADTKLGRHDRESTDPPEDLSDSPFDRLPCLEIKFSDIPQTNRGLIFGSGENCDVPLRKDHVSRIHFSLTFDDLNRPLIKDLNSLLGTQVTYNGDGRGMRRDFQWIVGGHKTPDEMGSIVIELWRLLSFQIVIVPHQITSPEYIDKVRRFQQGTMTAEDAINALGLNVPLTRPLSGVHTPGVGEIRLETRLGEGSFGAVHHLWDVSTGAESVVKRPSERATDDARCDSKARRALLSEWHNEANIMSQVSHESIVRYIGSDFDLWPTIYLEYMPGGSLYEHGKINYNQTLGMTKQCLSALTYLHARNPPIAHRDIKPANILVAYRTEEEILVKLADFGLSKAKDRLSSFCGTERYLAPEVYKQRPIGDEPLHKSRKPETFYDAVSDVWSLGVVACEMRCKMPESQEAYGTDGVAWCAAIVAAMEAKQHQKHTNLGAALLSTMLVLDPEARFSAADCKEWMELVPRKEKRPAITVPPGFLAMPTPQTLGHASQNPVSEDPESEPGSGMVTPTASQYLRVSGSVGKAGSTIRQHQQSTYGSSQSHQGQSGASSAAARAFWGSLLGGSNSEDSGSVHQQQSMQQQSGAGFQSDSDAGSVAARPPQGKFETFGGPTGRHGGEADGREDMEADMLLQAIGEGGAKTV